MRSRYPMHGLAYKIQIASMIQPRAFVRVVPFEILGYPSVSAAGFTIYIPQVGDDRPLN